MSDSIFGGISSDMDSLPDGYGETDLAGLKDWKLFGGEGTAKSTKSRAAEAEAEEEEGDEKERFWSNWRIAGGEGVWGSKSSSDTSTSTTSTGTSCKTGVGTGGYRYKIYSDGSIKVVSGPSGKLGKKYAAGTTAANNVKSEFPSEYALCTSSSTAAGKAAKKKSDSKRGEVLATAVGAAAGVLPQLLALFGPDIDVNEGEEETEAVAAGPNWLLWGGVGLGVIVVGGLIFMVAGKGDK